MPIVKDPSGHSIYVPIPQLATADPAEFFSPEEYGRRIERARRKVLDAIRFAERPLSGLGTCHNFAIDQSSPKSAVEQLADYADRCDDRRASKVRSQRLREARNGLAPYERRLRSPQPLHRRRSHLFGGKDIPLAYFGRRVSQATIDEFVQYMRWILIERAVESLWADMSLELVGDIWSVKVSRMDNHRLSKRQTNAVKRDDRSWHGRPNRDRLRVPMAS